MRLPFFHLLVSLLLGPVEGGPSMRVPPLKQSGQRDILSPELRAIPENNTTIPTDTELRLNFSKDSSDSSQLYNNTYDTKLLTVKESAVNHINVSYRTKIDSNANDLNINISNLSMLCGNFSLDCNTNNGFKLLSLSHVKDASVNKSGEVNDGTQNTKVKSALGSVDVVVPHLTWMVPRDDLNRTLLAGNRTQQIANKTTQLRQGRTDAPMLNYIFDTHSTLNKHSHRNDRFGGPRMESTGGKVSADVGGEAVLECRVSSLQDKLVSWLRRREGALELLTLGLHSFTADPRFASELAPPDTWRLRLSTVRADDEGDYECQLSTHPPLSTRHTLQVFRPSVELVDYEERDKYYERNSTLVLECRARHVASLLALTVTWRHQGRVLNDDTERGGVSVKTEQAQGGADSTLEVARLTGPDSGRYSCSVSGPGLELEAALNVHVLNESLAELHQGGGGVSAQPLGIPSHLFLLLISCYSWYSLDR